RTMLSAVGTTVPVESTISNLTSATSPAAVVIVSRSGDRRIAAGEPAGRTSASHAGVPSRRFPTARGTPGSEGTSHLRCRSLVVALTTGCAYVFQPPDVPCAGNSKRFSPSDRPLRNSSTLLQLV